MKKLLAVTQNINDGASICRVHPLTTLKGVKVQLSSSPSWLEVADCDILFVHRPVKESDYGLIKLAKKAGKKIWLDLDDAYFDIPTDHCSYSFYTNKDNLDRLKSNIEEADICTISNDNLKESFQKFQKPLFTTLCSYSEDYLLKYKPRGMKKELRICWRGSQTHRRSLMEAGDSIIKVSKQHPEWEWYFLGDSPWMFSDKMKTKKLVVNQDWIDVPVLHQYINAVQPAIQIMPLTDNYFTRCRSNMAWMDGLIGEAVTIAPDLVHWQVPGVLNYGNTMEEFTMKLDSTMRKIEGGIVFNVKEAWDYLIANYTYEAINRIQEGVLENL